MKDEEMRRPATPSYVASSQQRNNNFTLDSVLNLNGCWSRSVWPRPLPLPPPPPSLTLLFHFFFGIFPAQLLPIGVDGDAHVTRGGGVEGVWLRPPEGGAPIGFNDTANKRWRCAAGVSILVSWVFNCLCVGLHPTRSRRSREIVSHVTPGSNCRRFWRHRRPRHYPSLGRQIILIIIK